MTVMENRTGSFQAWDTHQNKHDSRKRANRHVGRRCNPAKYKQANKARAKRRGGCPNRVSRGQR